MTEAEWLAATDPYDLTQHKASRDDRKRRLLVCACVRRGLTARTDPRLVAAVEAAEGFADGAVSPAGLAAARKAARQARAELEAANARETDVDIATAALAATEKEFMHFKMAMEHMEYAAGTRDRSRWDARTAREARAQCAIARDIFGNPFRPAAFDPAWRTADALGLARAIYDGRAFGRLPLLADALMDAGCEEEAILSHCRRKAHVRGCWVVDLVLGRK